MNTTFPIIAPSILSADPGKFAEEISNIEAAGADWIHVDVMDGSFVPPITFGDNIVKVVRNSCKLFADVHLMIVEPQRHIETFQKAGANRIIIHLEACSELSATLKQIRALGISTGLAVNPGTDVQATFQYLDLVDLLLVMTVNPGWGGQKFIESCLNKVKLARREIDMRNLPTLIEVDGGINSSTSKECLEAGAQVLVAGSYIFGNQDRASAIKSLR